MADLILDVEARGTERAAAGMDKVASSTAKAGATWDSLKRKLGSGEVLRNAAASAALLASGAGNTTDKIAALGGALASIPGPVGMVASAVAVGATVLGVFSKQAEEAEKKAAELAKTLADLGKQRVEAQGALAERISGSVLRGGKDLRSFAMTPGAGQYKRAFDRLMPGNAPGAMSAAAQLAASGAPEAEKLRALDILATVKAAGGAGSTIDTDAVAKALVAAQEATAGFGGSEQEQRQALLAKELALGDAEARSGGMSGLGFGFEGRRVATDFQNREGALDVLGGAGLGAEAAGRRVSSAESPLGKVITDLLDKAEAPSVAESGRSWGDAMQAGTAAGGEALRAATDKAANSTNMLRISIERLDATIRGASGGGVPAVTELSDADAVFQATTTYGRTVSRERQ